jgi:hypothetical protein
MAFRLAPVLPRVGVLAALILGASATITFAAAGTLSSSPPAAQTAAPAAPVTLSVPDVQHQAFVFAKGILEDQGFAWRVTGSVKGYATNLVATQAPAPGTKVIDTGAPTISIVLAQNPHYLQKGTPEDASPFPGTALELATPAVAAKPKPAAKPKVKQEQAPATPTQKHATKPTAAKPATKRTPAFVVPGARKEPLTEIPLPDRAQLLATWLKTHTKPTDANVHHLLYQHAWIVTGAKFGWWHGAQALKTLIAVDRRTQQLWGIGARNERIARAALAEVEARSR